MAADGVKKRGRPVKPSPEGFDDCFRLQAYSTDTINSKRSSVRAFRVFLANKSINWRDATPSLFLDYAEELADHDLPYQAIINSVTTNKQITLWHSPRPEAFLINWRHTYESIKRMATERKSTSAAIIFKNRLNSMTSSLQSIIWFLLLSGLRIGSIKKAANSDFMRLENSSSIELYIRHIKYIPDDYSRKILVTNCSCAWNGTIVDSCVLHGSRALPNFSKVNWQLLEFELRRSGLSWHSTRRTVATYIKKYEFIYNVYLDENKINTLFGWNTGSSMLERYARGWETVNLELLPDLDRLVYGLKTE